MFLVHGNDLPPSGEASGLAIVKRSSNEAPGSSRRILALDLTTLNHAQLEAVVTTEGPLLVLAGAGSGKTRVITYRLAKLLEQGVSPRNILCVTFTNKAAFEMKVRAKNLVGKSLRGATLSTFHALGSHILREHPEKAGLRSGFTISDSGDQLGTLRRILRDLRIDDRKFDVKRILSAIGKIKNAGLDAEGYAEKGAYGLKLNELLDEEYELATEQCYLRYEQSLRAQNVVDFDDLLLLTQRLFEKDSELLEKLRHKWRYLMIDEYQDTNGAQFNLMRLLAGERKNICVVGDDDQSIYGWRGADIENILRFDTHFPGSKTVKLETNYRSTANILEVANSIIEKNTGRHDKRLKPAAGTGERVRISSADDEDAEAQQVAEAITALLAQGNLPKEIAVLFRSNVQSRAIELALRSANIAYRVAGGMDLFDKKEIKDLVAYLRVLDNPDDEQSLRRIINYPPRGIGDSTVERIDDWARERGLTLVAAMDKLDEVPGVAGKASDAITTFLSMLRDLRKVSSRRKIGTVVRKLVESVGLEPALLASTDSATVASRRVDNVRQILKQIDRYEDRIKTEVKKSTSTSTSTGNTGEVAGDDDDDDEDDEIDPATLSGFLADLALGVRDDGGKKDDKDTQVLLSTIHAAKGLEWKHVFVVGVEEELLPHARTLEGDGEIEEERRLAYVAVTRARERLVVSWARTRNKYGRMVNRDRSRFLEDLPPDAVEETDGDMLPKRTAEQKEALAQDYMAQIRARIGIK